LRTASVTLGPHLGGALMQKSFHLDEADVVLVIGALTAYQSELLKEVKSNDEMERETAKVDLENVNKLLSVFKA